MLFLYRRIFIEHRFIIDNNLAWLLSNDSLFIYLVFLYLRIWLFTVYSESRLSFSHTWRSWTRVFTQIRFLQTSYLQHDRRLPFLVGVSLLIDFVSASELTYHLRLTFAIGRIDSVIRHLVRITESPSWSISEITVTEVRSDLTKSNTETFCLLSPKRLSNSGLELRPRIGRPNCQYCLGTYPLMITCSFRIHKLIVLG